MSNTQPIRWENAMPTVLLDTGIPFVNGIEFVPVEGNEIAYVELTNSNHYKDAIINCAPLASIMMLCADAFSNGKFEVLNRATQNYTRGAYKEWDRLLNRPNFMANKSTFLKQLHTNIISNGYCYALPIYPSGFRDRPSAIFLLPPEITEVELKDPTRLPYSYKANESIRRVFINYGGKKTELKEEELILFTDNTPHVDVKTWLPQSRLKSLKVPTSIFTASENVTLTQTVKHGPTGIISPDNNKDALGTIPYTEEEKQNLQSELRRYGITSGQWQHIIANQAMKYTPIGSSIADLRLDENELKCIKSFCFLLGYPFDASPFGDRASWNNLNEGEKKWYQGSIMPQAANIVEQLNEGLKTPDQNIEIIVSYEDVYVFQQSQKDKGDGRRSMNQALQIEWNNGLITRNMWLEELGRDTIKGGLFDKYKFELTPEELGIVQQNVNNGATDKQSV